MIISAKDLKKYRSLDNISLIHLGDYNLDKEDIRTLKNLDKNVIIEHPVFKNGRCSLEQYLNYELLLDNLIMQKNLKEFSKFEQFLFAYYITRQFNKDNNYLLYRLTQKLQMPCLLQRILFLNNQGDSKNHSNILVYLKDDKYNVDGIYFSDPYLDKKIFNDLYGLNLLALPVQYMNKLIVNEYRAKVLDLPSFYYNKKLNNIDKE